MFGKSRVVLDLPVLKMLERLPFVDNELRGEDPEEMSLASLSFFNFLPLSFFMPLSERTFSKDSSWLTHESQLSSAASSLPSWV